MKISLKNRDRGILLLILFITAAALLQIPKIKVDGSSEIFIPENHEVTEINNRIEEEFGSMDSIILGIQVNFGTVLEPDVLALIDSISKELEALPEVDTLMSLTNMDFIKSSADGMEVVPLLEDLSDEGLRTMRERLTDWQDLYLGNFISRDSKLAVIILQPVKEGGEQVNQIVYEQIKKLTNQYKSTNISFPVAGLPVIKEEISNSILSDLLYLIPIAVLLILIILFLSFRRWEGVLYPLLSLVIACVWVSGLMGAMNITFTMASMLVPILLLVVGSAYGIHLMSHFYDELSRCSGFLSFEEVCSILNRGIRNIRLSVILAGATTAGGFISQLSSPLGPFRAFGILSALGVVFSQISMFLLIPLLLRFQFRKGIDTVKYHREENRDIRMKTPLIFQIFERIVRRRKVPVILLSTALLLLTAAVLPRLNVGINLIKFFKQNSLMVRDTAVFNEKLGGTGIISILIESPERGDILNPSFLNQVDRFEDYIKSGNEIVGSVQTLVPNIKRINKIMNFDQIPYGNRADETESFDFFADALYSEEENSFREIGETALPLIADKAMENIDFEDTAVRLGRALLDAGPDPGPADIIKTFLAQSNYRGAAFDEIPLDPAKYGLSSEEELHNLLSQYMVLYSGSLNMIINDSLEPDATLITVQVTDEETEVLDKLMEDIRSYWDYYLDEGWICSIGGGASISHALSSLVTKSQLLSLAGALIIVFIIVSLMFRSFIGGLIGMIPVLFGVMGIFLFMILFRFNLDIVTSLLAALAIGIGVDYAIHFINAYKRCRNEKEENVLGAVYRTTGKAIFINALSVAAGFLALLISRFVPIQQLGILFSVSMFFASMASLIVLPMVLEHYKPGFLDK